MKYIALLVALCGIACSPSIRRVDGMYRIKPCSSHEDALQCSRLAKTTCPEGYNILNPDVAEERGQLIICRSDDDK